MTQPPGTGSGPYGPQGQNPFGQQPAPDPYGSPPQTPAYGGQPPAQPTPQTPAYGAQPPTQNPYGSQPAPQAPQYGSPPQPQAPNPYGQQPPQTPYGPTPTPTPAPQAPAYGPTPTPAPQAPAYGASPNSAPATPTPQPTPAYPATPPSYAGSAPSATPYGASPTPQAPAYGLPPAASSFGSPTPTGGPQPYGSPPTPPQVPPYGSGQAAPPRWSGNGPDAPQAYPSAPQGFPPGPPVKKSRTGLIIGVVAAVLVLLGGGGYLLTNVLKNNVATPIVTPTATASSTASRSASTSVKPSASKSSATSSTSGYPGFKQAGSTLTGPNFTTTMPAGWSLSSNNGGKNEGEIVDSSNNIIDYYSDFSRSASANCTYQISSVTTASGVESSDPPVKVDGATWGGEATTGMKVTIKRDTQTKREVFAFFCVDHEGSGYLIRTIAWEADDASVLTGAKSLMAAWKWQ